MLEASRHKYQTFFFLLSLVPPSLSSPSLLLSQPHERTQRRRPAEIARAAARACAASGASTRSGGAQAGERGTSVTSAAASRVSTRSCGASGKHAQRGLGGRQRVLQAGRLQCSIHVCSSARDFRPLPLCSALPICFLATTALGSVRGDLLPCRSSG